MVITSLDCILSTVVIENASIPQWRGTQMHCGHFDWYLGFHLADSRQCTVTHSRLCGLDLRRKKSHKTFLIIKHS